MKNKVVVYWTYNVELDVPDNTIYIWQRFSITEFRLLSGIKSRPVVTQFKAYCFELLLRDAALVRFPLGRNFWPVYGLGVNPTSWGIWIVIWGKFWSRKPTAAGGFDMLATSDHNLAEWSFTPVCWQVKIRSAVVCQCLGLNGPFFTELIINCYYLILNVVHLLTKGSIYGEINHSMNRKC